MANSQQPIAETQVVCYVICKKIKLKKTYIKKLHTVSKTIQKLGMLVPKVCQSWLNFWKSINELWQKPFVNETGPNCLRHEPKTHFCTAFNCETLDTFSANHHL